MEEVLKQLYDAVLEGDSKATTEAVQAALGAGIGPEKVLNEGMVAAMGEVGRLFEAGEYYVPEMLIAARAMQSGLAILKPQLVKADIKPAG